MNDQMAHTHHLNNQLDINNKKVIEQSQKLQEQITIATSLNNTLKNSTADGSKSTQPKVTGNIIKNLPIMSKVPKNLTINSVCSSVEGKDDVQNSTIAEVIDDVKNAPDSVEVEVSKKRKTKNYKEKTFNVKIQVCDKMVVDKKVKYKIGLKPKKTPKRTNAKNLDEELDEKDVSWEIERDWSLTYYRRNKVLKQKQRPDLTVVGLENYRKQFGYEGELLIRFADGRRDWTYAINAKKDAKAKMYNQAMKKFKLTDEQFKFGLSKHHQVAAEKQKKLLKEKETENQLNSNKKQKQGKYSIH
jgi:hypothetical protein